MRLPGPLAVVGAPKKKVIRFILLFELIDMSQVIFELESELARKLNSFIQSYGDKEGLIEKFLDFYRNQFRREISHMNFDLKKFEEKYRMSSDDFIAKFSEGELDDSNDFQIWSGVWEMRKESEDKLKSLT